MLNGILFLKKLKEICELPNLRDIQDSISWLCLSLKNFCKLFSNFVPLKNYIKYFNDKVTVISKSDFHIFLKSFFIVVVFKFSNI